MNDERTRTVCYDLAIGEYEIRISGSRYERRQCIALEHPGTVTVTFDRDHLIDITKMETPGEADAHEEDPHRP